MYWVGPLAFFSCLFSESAHILNNIQLNHVLPHLTVNPIILKIDNLVISTQLTYHMIDNTI
jgi:hypothetical protein